MKEDCISLKKTGYQQCPTNVATYNMKTNYKATKHTKHLATQRKNNSTISCM